MSRNRHIGMGDFFVGIFKQAACGIWAVYQKINRVSLYCDIRFFCFVFFRRLYIPFRQYIHLLVRWPPVSPTQRR